MITFSSMALRLYHLIGKERKLLCEIGKLCPLPFERECKIDKDEVDSMDGQEEVVFAVDVMDENDEKGAAVVQTLQESMDANCLQMKKNKTHLVVHVSMDVNNEISVSIGK